MARWRATWRSATIWLVAPLSAHGADSARGFGTAMPSTRLNNAVDMRPSRRLAPRSSAGTSAGTHRTPDLATPVPDGAPTAGGPWTRELRHTCVAPSESLAAGALGDSAAALQRDASPPRAALCAPRARPPWRIASCLRPTFQRVVQVR